MVAGPLERADEIGFELSFDLIILLLVFGVSSSYVTGLVIGGTGTWF